MRLIEAVRRKQALFYLGGIDEVAGRVFIKDIEQICDKWKTISREQPNKGRAILSAVSFWVHQDYRYQPMGVRPTADNADLSEPGELLRGSLLDLS